MEALLIDCRRHPALYSDKRRDSTHFKVKLPNSNGRRMRSVCRSAWQKVQDPATGRPYYWNVNTNETAWEVPAESHPEPSTSTGDEAAAEVTGTVHNATMLENLKNAYDRDSSGMHFWEVARSHRRDGVFEEDFTEFLSAQILSADEYNRDFLQKVQARLSNPLLRQAAPFEF